MSRSATSAALQALTDSIVEKPPYVSGMLPLPLESLNLFYKTANDWKHLNCTTATKTQLDELAAACEPATFGRNKEDVLDESYRKAGKMNTDCFASPLVPERTELMRAIRDELLEGTDSLRPINIDLYKLNVYGEGSFFRAHVDTPRGKSMFGSLVVVLPTPHQGGSLILRDYGEEWTFDSGKAISVAAPAITFVAFYSDVEHEVSLVESGHRVTLTYNLYYDDMKDESPAPSGIGAASISAANETLFRTALRNALCNNSFLHRGGLLGFALRHKYPVKDRDYALDHLPALLKGSDAVIWRVCTELCLEPEVSFSCRRDDEDGDGWTRVAFDPYPWLGPTGVDPDGGVIGHLKEYFGADIIETGERVRRRLDWNDAEEDRETQDEQEDEQEDEKYQEEGQDDQEDDRDQENREDDQVGSDTTEISDRIDRGPVLWVTHGDESCTSIKAEYVTYGNEASLEYCYVTVCLLVDFPGIDERQKKGFVPAVSGASA